MTHPLCALAREFVHDEVDEDENSNIKWHLFVECFVAWLKFHNLKHDYDYSVLCHWLTSAIKGENFFRSKANLRKARFFLGSPQDLLDDLSLESVS